MAKCNSCGTPEVYNSGFSVECLNPACHFYSEKHRRACLGKSASFRYTEKGRKVTIATPEYVDTLRISSKTTPVLCEMCYSANKGSFSLARWKGDGTLECRVNGNTFSAIVEAFNQKSLHQIVVELLSSDGTTLYYKEVDFDSTNLTFEVNVDS